MIICALPGYAGVYTIFIYNHYFTPDTIDIEPGDTIVWVNMTIVRHTATSGQGCEKSGDWDSGLLEQGETYMKNFPSPGRIPYFCIPHCALGMVGMILVGDPETPEKELEEVVQDGGFRATRIINMHTSSVLGKNVLNFLITHRFDDLTDPAGGGHRFYGLDNIREERIGLEYGIVGQW